MVGETVKGNLKKRIESVSLIPNNAAKIAGVVIDRLSELKPVQAVAEGLKGAGDGIFDFVDTNAEITRDWIQKVK